MARRLTYRERKDIEETILMFFGNWSGLLQIFSGASFISLSWWLMERSVPGAIIAIDRQIARSCGIDALRETEMTVEEKQAEFAKALAEAIDRHEGPNH